MDLSILARLYRGFDALDLFRRRAELVGRSLTEEQLETASAICERLHDNPLYIRLAAAYLQRRPLRVLLRGLNGETGVDERLRWPPTPHAGVEERHRGIGDAIAWSYELCDDEERLLFDRMSVFAPECELAAIEAVCADDPGPDDGLGAAATRLPRGRIEHLLQRLVRRSLVSVHPSPTGPRYSLLESLRLFAGERLRERTAAAAGDPARRHLEYYRNRVIDAAAHWFGPREDELMRWMRSAWPNLRTAIRTGLDTPAHAVLGLEICVGLQAFPASATPSLWELRQWTERAAAAAGSSAGPTARLRSQATAALAWIALRQGSHDDAERWLRELRHRRDTATAAAGPPAIAEFVSGCALWMIRQDGAAVGVLARARDEFERDGEPGMAARCAVTEAAAAALLCGPEDADRRIGPLRARAGAAASRWAMAWADLIEAVVLIHRGNAARATDLIARAATHLVSAGDLWGAAWAVMLRIWALALSIAGSGGPGSLRASAAAEVARLAGVMDAVRAGLGIDLGTSADLAERTAAAVEIARDLLGAEAFGLAHAQGARLDLKRDGLERMLSGTVEGERRQDRLGGAADSRWDELSKSEQHVALLAAAGWTNTAIAARRGTSVRTVHAQIAATLHKLMISSRRDIAGFVPAPRRFEILQEAARRTRSDPGGAVARGMRCSQGS
ncbi:ATP-binding protein [Nocardia wallacei]|uniref:ATP-binding protein n=1 Tax=Nocardia wallacei TaxID=480035 RepID=UPI002458A4EB|nr:LuxR C-terminal-related transcriptional regulator [Nocardia wallacei]